MFYFVEWLVYSADSAWLSEFIWSICDACHIDLQQLKKEKMETKTK